MRINYAGSDSGLVVVEGTSQREDHFINPQCLGW